MPAPIGKLASSFPPRSARLADLAALIAGALLPLAFAPVGLWPLAFLSPAALFLLWREGGPARATWRGFLFGLGFFGVGVSWVYVSLHDFGHMPAPLAALATALFVAGLSLYPALLGGLQAWWFDRTRPAHLLLVLPALWTLFEWWRGWFLTGFPWLDLGYSQPDTWLAGYAPLAGVYGVSLAVALVAGLLAQSWYVAASGILRAVSASPEGSRTALAHPCASPGTILTRYLPVLLVIFAGGGFAGRMEWTEPAGAPVETALVQGNVPLELKWQPAYREPILERYRALSARAEGARLIVWPEAAIPARLDEVDPRYLVALQQWGESRNADFLIGVVERDNVSHAYYNSVIALGRQVGDYRKRHLVPFGEFLPLPALFRWLLDSLQIPMSDFSKGPPDQPPLAAAGQRIGVSVCYEDAFGEEVIRQLPEATLLVNVSEDAWFGDSLAPHQRLQMARLRALETGRPMLRAANTGPSAAIDHRGRVLARAPQFQAIVLPVVVQPMAGATPYVRVGNLPVVLLSVLLLATAVAGRRGVVARG